MVVSERWPCVRGATAVRCASGGGFDLDRRIRFVASRSSGKRGKDECHEGAAATAELHGHGRRSGRCVAMLCHRDGFSCANDGDIFSFAVRGYEGRGDRTGVIEGNFLFCAR